MITLYEQTASFARPADTVTYASGDLISNSTTSGSVVALSWAFPSNAPVKASAIRLALDKSDVSNATFRLHLLSGTPTFASTGDNAAASAAVATGYDKLIVAFEGTLSTQTADGASGMLMPMTAGPLVAFRKIPTAGITTTLYGYVEARGAYAPKSGGVISATLILEK